MPRPRDIAAKATAESRAKGGRARAEKMRAERAEERALLAEVRADRLDQAIGKLSAVAAKAADAIDKLLDADNEGVKLRAAVSVLELLLDCEIREMSDRLERLEHAARSNGRLR